MEDEGYCSHCNRLELLTDEGFIIQHTRSDVEYGKWHLMTCKGSGTKPGEQPEET